MKITEKQLIELFNIVRDSLAEPTKCAGVGYGARFRLVNEILNQQSNTIVNVRGRNTNTFDVNDDPDGEDDKFIH